MAYFSQMELKRSENSTLSIFTTEAPKSAKSIPQNGPGANPASSITRIPFSGPGILNLRFTDAGVLKSEQFVCEQQWNV